MTLVTRFNSCIKYSPRILKVKNEHEGHQLMVVMDPSDDDALVRVCDYVDELGVIETSIPWIKS